MKKSKKLSPLEELRIEKNLLKSECSAKETDMSSYFSYLSNNLGSIVFGSILNGLGLTGSKKASSASKRHDIDEPQEETVASSTIMQTVWNGLQITYPYIKEIAQPLIIGFVANKVKNLFSPKEKKKKN